MKESPTSRPRPHSRRLKILLIALGATILAFPGASIYYEYSGGQACARCHEIWQPYTDWHTSAHRSLLVWLRRGRIILRLSQRDAGRARCHRLLQDSSAN